MGFLEELLVSAKNVVDKAGKKTDKVVEVSKLKYQSIQLQNELSHLYEQLGVATYGKMVEEVDNGDLLASLADEITEVRAALKAVEEKLSEQKNERICPECGAKSSRDAKFCANGGVKFTSPEPEADEAEEAADSAAEEAVEEAPDSAPDAASDSASEEAAEAPETEAAPEAENEEDKKDE